MHIPIETLDLLGYELVLIRKNSKAPVRKGWTDHAEPLENILAHVEQPGHGLGVKLGGPAGIIDIEGDGPRAAAAWADVVGDQAVPKTASWRSARGAHQLFQLNDETRRIVGNGVFKLGDLEFRFGEPDKYTMQSVIPPCGDRQWIHESPIVRELPVAVAHRIAAARLAQTTPLPQPVELPDPVTVPTRPGDFYNQDADWEEILTEDGWIQTPSKRAEVTNWLRPDHDGKDQELSANVNYTGDGEYEPDRLHVFSSNAPVPAGRYTKFAYLAAMHHAGDFAAATKWCADQGYGLAPACAADVFEEIPSFKEEGEVLIQPKDIIFPGWIEDFVAHNEKVAHRSDPVASAGVAFGALSCLMGRCVKTEYGTFPNIAIAVLGMSGCGKTLACNTAEQLFTRLGVDGRIYNEFKSKEGFEDTMVQPGNENLFVIQEEAQDKLRALSQNNGNQHQAGLVSRLKEVATKGGSVFRSRAGVGDGEIDRVHMPHLTLLWTAVPELFWGSMTAEQVSGGFLGRLWVVELGTLKPRNKNPQANEFLQNRMDQFARGWVKEYEKILVSAGDGIIVPRTVPMTDESKAIRNEYLDDIDRRATDATDNAELATLQRAPEFVSKLELLGAGSESYSHPKITAAITRRAIHLTEVSLVAKSNSTAKFRQDDYELERSRQAIMRVLNREDAKGNKLVTRSAIMQKAHVRARHLNAVLVEALPMGELFSNATLRPDGMAVAVTGSRICLPKHRKELENFLKGKLRKWLAPKTP